LLWTTVCGADHPDASPIAVFTANPFPSGSVQLIKTRPSLVVESDGSRAPSATGAASSVIDEKSAPSAVAIWTPRKSNIITARKLFEICFASLFTKSINPPR
jgi:hypothetical protein